MKTTRSGLMILTAMTAVLLVLLPSQARRSASAPAQPAQTKASQCPGLSPLSPDLPGDSDFPSHAAVQCFAWQEFVALQWPAKPGSPGEPDRSRGPGDFGKPGDRTPFVWETYKDAHEVFLADGSKPAPWGTSGLRKSLSAVAENREMVPENAQAEGFLVLRMSSKVSPQAAHLRNIIQAGGGWLAAQNKKLTHYAIHMNRAAFDYIVGEGLYDARNQAGKAINFPAGRLDTRTPGAVVVKSAWLEITDPKLFPRFRMTKACIVENGKCRKANVGLVGLHIVHKTKSFPQWAWATFEHVDNAPDREEVRLRTLKSSYTYFDPKCTTCTPNQKPKETDPKDRPIQVVRETPLPAGVKTLNQEVHKLIRKANGSSVWQYYDLIEVQWPQAPSTMPGVQDVPLTMGGPFPTSLANATLETYVQPRFCLNCHRSARIACSSKALQPKQNADYSFLLTLAREPTPPKECQQ